MKKLILKFKNKKILFVLIFMYVLTYFIVSASGKYKYSSYGLSSNEKGEPQLTLKHIGLEWHPFKLYQENGAMTVKHIIYYPLVMIDSFLRDLFR